MPPKRKRKPSSDQPGHAINSPVPAPVVKKQAETEAQNDAALLDMWTDEQETCLLKAVIRWKPVGMHKHFRMANIYEYLREQGVINPIDKHTTVAGIWAKLGSWYNLPTLDEREDSLTFDNIDAQNVSEDWSRNFSLPDDEYRDMMFQRRLNPDGSQSPPASTNEGSKREPSSPPAQGQNRRPLRGGRGRRQVGEVSSPSSAPAQTLDDTTMEEAEHESIAGEESSAKKGRTRNARGKPAGRARGRRGGR